MIKFFKDVLSGPLYIVTTILSIILIMAIIGFIMERKKLEKEAKSKVIVVDSTPEVTPIATVTVQTEQEMKPVSVEPTPVSNLVPEKDINSPEVKKPVIVFEDSEEKTE